MLRRTIGILTVVSALMLGVLLTITTPSAAGPLGILGFFVFMYTTVLGLLTFLLHSLSSIAAKTPFGRQKRQINGAMLFKNAYYYASVIALVPVMFVAMVSVGQVGPYQVLLVGLFVIIAWIYITNRAT